MYRHGDAGDEVQGGTYLLLIPHGALASHHDFASGLRLQLLGGQPSGSENSPHEVIL